MPAGAVALPILDGNAVSRNVLTWSSTAAISGNLSPLQGILGADGLTISTAANGFPVTIENASLAVTGTFFQATQPISATSLPLPTNAATSANITTPLGTSSLFGTVGAGAAPTNALAIGGQYNSTPITLTNTQFSAAQLDANGYLNVHIQAGAAAGGTSSNFAASFPAAGTAIGLKNGANMVNGIADASGNMGVLIANGANQAAVKAASTAPLATDPALVVSISPNSTNANGSATSANSAPVVIASDQAAVATKAASSAFATGSIVDLGTATTPAAGTANASLQTLAGAVTSSVLQDNIKQVNGVTVLTGTGAVGTGAQRIAVGTDTATIAGSAPGTAGTPSANVITVQGAVASGSAVTGAPLTQGGRGATANPTAVADGQAVNTMHDKLGKLVAVAAIRTLKKTQNTIITASTAETTIVTQTASVFNDLYGLILANTGATTTKVDIRDTTAGSIIATIEVPTLDTRGFMLPADSGLSQTTVNTNWTAQCGSSTSSLQVTALFVQNT